MKEINNGNCWLLTQLYDYIGREFTYTDYEHIQEMLITLLKERENKHEDKCENFKEAITSNNIFVDFQKYKQGTKNVFYFKKLEKEEI